MTSQHGLNKLATQIKPFSKLFISPKFARIVTKIIEPELRLKEHLNDDYLEKIKKSLNLRTDNGLIKRNGLNRIDFDRFKDNLKELLNEREQLKKYQEDKKDGEETKDNEFIQKKVDKIYNLEKLVIPIILRLPNLFNEDEIPIHGYDDKVVNQTKTKLYNFKILDGKRISYVNNFRKSSILGPHCEYLLGKGALISLALQKYFRKSIQDTFPHPREIGKTHRHLHEVDGVDFVKSALVEAANDYDQLNYENDSLEIDLKELEHRQKLHLVSCSKEGLLSLIVGKKIKNKHLPARFVQFGSSYEQNLRQVNTIIFFTFVENDFNVSNDEFKKMENLIWKLYEKFNLPIRMRKINLKKLQFNEYNRIELDVYFPYSREWKKIAHFSHHSDYLLNKVHSTDLHCLSGNLTNFNLFLDAILENNQTETGEIELPECIQKYF